MMWAQIVCHHVAGYNASSAANAVDGDAVPVPHFGLAMDADSFHALAERVREAGIHFEIEPHLRFKGEASWSSHIALSPKAVMSD